MKRQLSLGLAAVLMSIASAAFAQPADSDATKAKGMDWIKSHLEGQTYKTLPGLTASGRRCALYLTDRTFDSVQDYYVVVGYAFTKDKNEYIGMPVSHSTVNENDFVLSFAANESWGNDSRTNRVKIALDAQGKPLQATGVSDLKTIDCKLE